MDQEAFEKRVLAFWNKRPRGGNLSDRRMAAAKTFCIPVSEVNRIVRTDVQKKNVEVKREIWMDAQERQAQLERMKVIPHEFRPGRKHSIPSGTPLCMECLQPVTYLVHENEQIRIV